MNAEPYTGSPPARSERRLFLGAAALMVLALLLGGQANGNAVREMLIQLAALFVAFTAYTSGTAGQVSGDRVVRAAKWVLTGTVGLVLLHLVPLPYDVWAALSPVDAAQQVLDQLGLANGWRPFALNPAEAFDNLLLLLPPIAMFYAALRLSQRSRTRLAMVAVGLAVVSASLGLLQYGSGTQSLDFYDVTHIGFGSGFFANRNHQADFAIIGWLLAAGLIASPWVPTSRYGGAGQGAILLIASALFILAVLATGSRGGFLLAGFAALAILVIRFAGNAGKLFGAVLGGGALGGIVLAVAASSGSALLGRTLERFTNDDEVRLIIWPRVAEIVGDTMPLGAGIGSFIEYYRFTEPLDMVGPKYVNSAHNEFLEIALDAGIPGLALLVAGICVIAWAAFQALRGGLSDAGSHRRLQAVAGVAVLVLISHSSFDYPLRTTGLAVMFAFLCGLLMPRPSDSTVGDIDPAISAAESANRNN